MCARCHSYARVALQRRPRRSGELAHFHLGQYPTTEYQALGRDRNWWEIASEQCRAIAGCYPFDAPAWRPGSEREPVDLSGEWRIVGPTARAGDYEGGATVERTRRRHLPGRGELGLRGWLQLRRRGQRDPIHRLRVARARRSARTIRAGARGLGGRQRMTGRLFLAKADAIGGRLTQGGWTKAAARAGSVARPSACRRDRRDRAPRHRARGRVGLGDGVTIEEVVRATPRPWWCGRAPRPRRQWRAHGERRRRRGEGCSRCIKRSTFVTVEPSYNIARVGGGGGPSRRCRRSSRRSPGWTAPDGEPEPRTTSRSARCRRLDGEELRRGGGGDGRCRLRGQDEANGLFLPAKPGRTRNGSTTPTTPATSRSSPRRGRGPAVTGEGQLIVTVQRWNDPPIR